MEQPDASLQLILPTDKRNPCFTLYQSIDYSELLDHLVDRQVPSDTPDVQSS